MNLSAGIFVADMEFKHPSSCFELVSDDGKAKYDCLAVYEDH